jgi:predicted GIY-YIG superfamily endonuclease
MIVYLCRECEYLGICFGKGNCDDPIIEDPTLEEDQILNDGQCTSAMKSVFEDAKKTQKDVRAIYVYELLNKENGKRYIGQTVNLRRRFLQHKRSPPVQMREDIKDCVFEEVMSLSILSTCYTKKHANLVEKGWIKDFKSTNVQHGYNVLKGHPFRDGRFWAWR